MRGTAIVFGPILCLVAMAVGAYVVGLTGDLATDTRSVSGYWSPGGLERLTVAVGLGIFGLVGAGLFGVTGVGLVRHARGRGTSRPRWIVKTAAAAPIVTFAWFVAAMYFWSQRGGFS